MGNEGWGRGDRGARTHNHNEKKDGERERQGGERERDADQLITAANKMLIYPGAVSKFKHGAIPKKTCELRGQRANDGFQTKNDDPVIIIKYGVYELLLLVCCCAYSRDHRAAPPTPFSRNKKRKDGTLPNDTPPTHPQPNEYRFLLTVAALT